MLTLLALKKMHFTLLCTFPCDGSRKYFNYDKH